MQVASVARGVNSRCWLWYTRCLQQLPGFGGIKLDRIPEALTDGARCFVGDTSVPVFDGDTITG